MTDLITRLRDRTLVEHGGPDGIMHGWNLTPNDSGLHREAADEIERLRSVMVAAAEEISAHWDAHCDAEGYGPANLMRRLEEGIASQYGYTAGAFAELKSENEKLRAAAEQARAALSDLTSLKDMKGRLTALHEMGHGTDWDSYHKRKPLAWPAARDALRALDAALTPAPTIAIAPVYRSVDDYAAPPTPPASQGTP